MSTFCSQDCNPADTSFLADDFDNTLSCFVLIELSNSLRKAPLRGVSLDPGFGLN